MKQKVVIKIMSLKNHKSRSKAMKIVVGCSGVEGAGIKGDDKEQIEITGEGVDAAVITNQLRKKVGYAELVSVGPMEPKKEPEEPKPQKPTDCHGVVVPRYCIAEYHFADQYREPSCPIL